MNEIRARVIAQEKRLYKITDGWPEDGSSAVITGLFPRKSCFMRKAAGPGKQEQVVAANIDTVFLCMSLNNNFNLRRQNSGEQTV